MEQLTTPNVAKYLDKVIWCELATRKGGNPNWKLARQNSEGRR
jgi:hypothetical protein